MIRGAFADFVSLLDALDLDDDGARGRRRPPRDNVRAVQHALTARLADEAFYLDCVDLELAAVVAKTPTRPAPPLYRLPDRGLHFRMYYWWPGKVAVAHEHTAWTVTAVFFNALQVTTFDWDVARSARRLAPKNVFSAAQGAAGHIFEPCIHSPANPTATVSTSIHLFNATDRPWLVDDVGPIDGMGRPNRPFVRGPDELARLDAIRQRQLRVLARVVRQFPSPRARDTLRRIGEHGDATTRAIADRIAWSITQHRRLDEGTRFVR